VDNYFAERVYLEEEVQLLNTAVAAYQQKLHTLARHFLALYQALGSETAVAGVMEWCTLSPWPFYEEFQKLPPSARPALLHTYRGHGFTARRRLQNLILDIFARLAKDLEPLKEAYAKIQTHLRLLNEDIDKFNTSFDFGLIAAQIEAMEGGGAIMAGGLDAGERMELSTRMRFKRRKFTPEELPPPPPVPPLKTIQRELAAVLARHYLT
jgi:uncharacterized coiled-coil protein SlyX